MRGRYERTTGIWVFALMAGLFAAGCRPGEDGGVDGQAATGSLSGTVLYRERIALPADATIVVRLEDVSRADAPADVVASQTIAADGRQVPIPFELDFAPERIEPNRRYALRAEIRAAGGELLFTTMTNRAVLEPGAANEGIEILVQRVSSGGGRGEPAAAGAGSPPSTGSIMGETWRLVAITRAGAAPEPVPPEPSYTIEFRADGRYGGQAHCNRYTGGYERPGPDRLAMSAGAATLAACLQPSISDEFLRTVAAVTRYVVRGDELELSTDDGRSLTFSRASSAAAAPEVGRTFVFDCPSGESFTVRTGPGEVALWVPESIGGQYVVLGMTESDSGVRYEDGDTVYWNQGELATFEIAGRTFADCRSNPSKVPWADAKRRGAILRALGNEPSWNLEVYSDRLVMVTNLGADRVELAHGGPVVEGVRTTYRAAAGGRELVAVIERRACTDSMSGEPFEAVATVTLGAETYRGCGRFL